MDYFPIIISIARTTVANNANEAQLHQFSRLIGALKKDGEYKQAKQLQDILTPPHDPDSYHFKLVQS